jgi:hypothetical protein
MPRGQEQNGEAGCGGSDSAARGIRTRRRNVSRGGPSGSRSQRSSVAHRHARHATRLFARKKSLETLQHMSAPSCGADDSCVVTTAGEPAKSSFSRVALDGDATGVIVCSADGGRQYDAGSCRQKRGKRFSAAGLQAAAPVVTPAEADAFGVSSPTAMRLAQLASSPAERKDSRFIGGRSSPGALLRHGGGPANHTVHPRFPPRWSQTYQRYPGQPNRSPGVSPDRTLQHEVATFLQERGDLLGDELRPLVDDQRPVEILGVVDPVLDLVKVISK